MQREFNPSASPFTSTFAPPLYEVANIQLKVQQKVTATEMKGGAKKRERDGNNLRLSWSFSIEAGPVPGLVDSKIVLWKKKKTYLQYK